jgi:hypothetical protein
MSNKLEAKKFKPVLLPAPVDVEASFPKGIIFKKAEITYKYDRENKKSTEEKEAIRISCIDVFSKEDFTVKIPLDAELPEDIEDLELVSRIQFENLSGMRMGFDIYFKADGVKFE